MSMMQVRVVRMRMNLPPMGMGMHMGLAGRIAGAVLMLVMLVMNMRMGVRYRLMDMLMIVPLDEMEIETDRHQEGCSDQPGGHRLPEHGEC